MSDDDHLVLRGQADQAFLEAMLVKTATELGLAASARGLMLATAESCTGGAMARALTEVSGSSAWFDSALVTYSNRAKAVLLGVEPGLLAQHGAVSEPVVRAMAAGVLLRSGADRSVAVTGVAGPGGGSADKPVGTVWFGWAARDPDGSVIVVSRMQRFDDDRVGVRLRTAIYGLNACRKSLDMVKPTG